MNSKKEKNGDHIISDSDDSSNLDIDCDICRMEFTSVKSYEQHLKSKKHNKMLDKNKLKTKLAKSDGLKEEAKDKEDDDQDSEVHCDTCEKKFSELSQYKAHMRGSVHSKNLKKQKLKEKLKDVEGVIEGNVENEGDDDGIAEKPFAYCAICQKSFTGPESYQQHLKSTTHEKKRRHRAVIEKFKNDNPDDTKPGDGEDEGYLKCEVCLKFFSGLVPYSTHMESAIHKKEVRRLKIAEDLKEFYFRNAEDGKFVCKECKRPFTDPLALKIHLEKNDHEKQKSKRDIMALLSSHPEIVPVKSSEYSVSDEEGEINRDTKQDYDFLVCNICHLSFNGPTSAQDHVNSKKHVKAKQQKEEMKALKRKLKKMKPNAETEIENHDVNDLNNAETVSPSDNDTVDNALGTLKQQRDDFEFI